MNRLVIAAIAVAAALYVLFSSLYVVNEREQAIVVRFGGIIDVKTEPGLYFKIPTDFVDSVQIIEDRLLRYDLSNMTVQVQGGAFYEVDAFLTYKIVDPRRFREVAQGDLRIAEDRISTRFTAALREVYGVRSFNAALSQQRAEMMTQARNLIRPGVAELGIDIVDVRILRTDLSTQVSERTYERMRAERLAEAALLRARGQQAADTIRAIADRQAVEIRAEAQRDADILRGEGDAERNRIFAAAYNADPEFFQFYRSMESYRNALGNTGTTMVLSPDSEFFRYFENQGEGTPGKPLPEPQTPDIPVPTDVPANELPNLAPDSGLTDGTGPLEGTGSQFPAEVTPSVPPPGQAAPAEAQPATP
ncbi:MAG: SPFH domain-containing protein [Devosia sp.]